MYDNKHKIQFRRQFTARSQVSISALDAYLIAEFKELLIRSDYEYQYDIVLYYFVRVVSVSSAASVSGRRRLPDISKFI